MSLPAFAWLLCAPVLAHAQPVQWTYLSSRNGDLPDPGGSHQQTGLLAAKLNPKSNASDLVIGFRVKAPALIGYRYSGGAWTRYLIEKDFLTLEAGGAAFDIDADGDLDIVFGADGQGNHLWWWENPHPRFDAGEPWKRRMIKSGGANQHHDQVFADFLGLGKAQLVYWNQRAKALLLALIPPDPRHTEPWPAKTVFSGQAGEGVDNAAAYAEGVDAFDVDGDGRVDLLAGNYWFKYLGGKFLPVKVGMIGGRIKAARFKQGKNAQIVIGPGDGSGPLKIYECQGDAAVAGCWQGRDLLGRDMVHGHTLDLGDINGDGHMDIFAAEMAKWTNKPLPSDHPGATAWILYGDGKSGFDRTVLVKGHGWHEGKLADVDGDGDLDVVNKPYTWNAPRIDIWRNNGRARAASRSFDKPVGMELYTYRNELKKDLPGTLAQIRKLGFTDIETASFYGRPAAEFRKLLDQNGLTCSSIITGYDRLGNDLEGVVQDAKAVGAAYVLTAGIPRKGKFTLDDARRAAGDFNRWGERLSAEGLRFGYHPHGFEFVPHQDGTLFDVLVRETLPAFVDFEMDVFWFWHGGGDPAKYLEKYPDRFTLIHLKDMAKGTPIGDLTGRAPDDTSVAMGAGQIPWPAVLRAAGKAAVKFYYIEDESPAAPRQVPLSLQYLKKLRY